MINRLLVAAPVLVLSSVIAPVADAQTPLMVSVTYWKRSCGAPAALAQSAPVTAGTLQIRDGTGTPITVTLGPNPVPITAAASPLTATLLLETPRVKVVSGASSSTAVTIDLSPAVVLGGIATFAMYLREDDRNGSINALMELDRAAEFAGQANGAPLPQLTAHVLDGPGAPAGNTHYDTPAKINVIGATDRDDRWEAVTLIHEYGHFVMEQLAPGGPSGGAHNTEKSYPQQPDLAWTEGFAWGFAGVVTKPELLGVMLYRCGPYMSFADTPARPRLATEDARYAQYNETRVGAATYHLVESLGGGVPGFKRLLDAMKNYKRDGHPAWTARDLRDLAVEAFETTAADHAAIDDIFRAQGMSWLQGFSVGLGPGDNDGLIMRSAVAEIVVSVTGPGGFQCRTARDLDATALVTLDGGRFLTIGEKAADGGLPYSKNDDCYLVSGDGVVSTRDYHAIGGDRVEIPFPYLSGLAHWTGSYTVTAKFVCDYNQWQGARSRFRCPPTFDVRLAPHNLSMMMTGLMTGGWEPIPVKLVRGVEMHIVTFKANGECTAIGKIDCGF